MAKTVAIIGALDTKGQEFAFLKAEIETRGCKTLVINVGVLGTPLIQPEVSAEEVAAASGVNLGDLIARHDRGEALGGRPRVPGAQDRYGSNCGRLYGSPVFSWWRPVIGGVGDIAETDAGLSG